ncbi:FtsX-like permease family protein [Demequina lutea]|uniref:ABC3 transporter permease C-terminal domain-containing protein n=1 Tax=Demequina lutea TaxID=431489 RepID=A0A7Y9Z7C4_9MICO|nr:FtsX-like permease family protein [Demequina lutea]NYI40164.1 hypothetical protein [Demequina lutea]
MRWLASLTIGIAALLGGLGFGRVMGPAEDPNMRDNPYAVLVAVAVYGTFFMVILGVVAVSLRRLAVSARAREWNTERALGGTLRRVVISEARLGLRHGILVSGSLVLLGAAARQLLPWFDGHSYLRGGHFEPAGLAGIVLVFVMCATTTVAVYVVAALAAIGASDGPGAIPASVRPSRLRERAGRALKLVAIALYVVSVAGLIWRRVFPIRWEASPTHWGSAPQYWWVSPAVLVFVLGGVVLVTGAVASMAGLLSRVTGRALISRGRGVLLQAGDALARPSTERRIAVGTMAIVLGLVTWVSGASDISRARNQLADAFLPLAIVTPSVIANQDMQATAPPEGYPTATLDPTLVESLAADTRLIAIPFAYLRADTLSVENPPSITCGGDHCVQQNWRIGTYVVVDPGALTRFSPDGLRPFGFAPGVAMQGSGPFLITSAVGSAGPTWLMVDGTRYPIYRSGLNLPASFIDAAWARSRFGEPPVTGLWLKLAHPDGLTAQEQLDTMHAILAAHIGSRTDVAPMTYDYGNYGTSTGGGASAALVGAAIVGLLLGVALVGSLAARSARDRRRELATMAALGASPRTLRLTPVVEMLVTTLSAVVSGVGAGLILAIATTQPTLFAPGAPLSFGDTMWLLHWNASQISWGPIGAVVLAAVLLTTAVAAVFAAAMGRRTPVEQLREAIKEGAA